MKYVLELVRLNAEWRLSRRQQSVDSPEAVFDAK